ncbi:MAG: GldG family protein, partial [Candidatus Hydrogenedentota bacterium]
GLLLNVVFIDIRSRPNARLYFSATVAVCVVIGLLGNWLVSDTSLVRFDATEDKIYTMSEASKRILSELDTPVQVKYYVTPKNEMPTGLTTIEADVTSKLQELGIAANGNIQFQPVHLSAANVIGAEPDSPDEDKKDEGDEETVIEKRMLEKGVQPFSVQAMSEDQMTNKLVYSTLGVGYKDKQEELIAPVMPENLDELEYRIVSTVYKLTREKKPVVALFAPTEAVNIDPQMKQMLMQMGQEIPTSEDPYKMVQRVLDAEKYEVQRVHLTAESPMPEAYDTLVVINPRGLNERQRWELNRAIVSGKPVIMAVQTYEWDYTPNNRGSVSISRREENPSVNELLASYGVQVSKEVLMDENHIALTVSSGSLMDQLTGRGMTLPLPMHIMVNSDQMDQETSITSRLSSVFYLWGTALQLDDDTLKDTKLDVRPLLYSTANSWTIGDTSSLTQASFVKPDTGLQKFPLMAMVTGQFPNAYDSVERPAWPQEQPQPGQPPRPPVPEDGPAPAITPAPGKLILIGCSEMFRDNFIQQAGNMDLIMNSIDAITLGDDIVNVRSRKPIDRAIGKPTNSQRTFWKTVNYGFSPTLIAVAGIMVTTLRRRSRNTYTLAQQSASV